MSSAFGDLNGTGNQQVWVYTSLSSQDINGNFSQYYGEIRYYGNGWGSWTNSTQYWSGNFNGQVVSGTFTIPSSQANQSYTTLWTGYYNIGHNADGTMGGFGISASIDTNHTSIGDGTASATEGAAPTIPRASTPSFSPSSTLTTGTAVTINTNWASSSFTHTIVWSFGTLSNQTTGFSASSGIGASLTWTPPESMLAQIPNATSGTGNITLTTKSGSTTIGTKTVAFTLNAASTVKPTVSAVTIADQNATVVSAVGAYVQTLSSLKGTVTAAGIQGSTISSSSWSMSGTSVASGSTITPTASGTVAIGGAATDTRGRVGTYSANITVMPYVAPKITTVTFKRSLDTGVFNDNGTYIRMDLNAAVQSLFSGAEKNTLTIKVFSRVAGTTTWTARNNFVHTAVSYNTNILVTGGAIFPINQAYELKVEITDKFNTATPAISQATVSTAAIFMHWSTTGIGIGKYHTQGVLDIQGDMFAEDVYITGGYTPITVTDWNLALKTGAYNSTNTAINAPWLSYWMGQVYTRSSDIIQVVQRSNDKGLQFTRTYASSAWGDWYPVGIGKGTASVRNAFYGTPTVLADQVALANTKPIWFNTDMGWMESYYVATGSTGLTVTGLLTGLAADWYPIDNNGPSIAMEPSASFAATAGNYIGGWNGVVNRVGGSTWFTAASTYILISKPGYYDLHWWTNQVNGAGQADYHTRLTDSAQQVVDWMSNVGGQPLSTIFTRAEGYFPNTLVRGPQRFLVLLVSGGLAVHQVTGGTTYPSARGMLKARYVGPPTVSV